MVAKRNKNSALGIIRYNKVVAQTRKTLKKQGYNLSYNDARKYVSNYVYPTLKGTPTYKLYNTTIERQANKVIKYNEPGLEEVPEDNNIDYLNWADMHGVEFWELQDIMDTLLPPNAWVIINAGAAGEIKRFKVKDWAHKQKIWSEILASIRYVAATTEKPSGESGKFYWSPIVKHIPGKPNNKDIRNNVIEFRLLSADYDTVFNEHENEEKNVIEVTPKGTREKGSKKRKKSQEFTKKVREKRKKFLADQKSKKPKVSRKITPAQLIKITELRTKELELLRQDFKDGLYTKAQYKKEREKIINRYPV